VRRKLGKENEGGRAAKEETREKKRYFDGKKSGCVKVSRVRDTTRSPKKAEPEKPRKNQKFTATKGNKVEESRSI